MLLYREVCLFDLYFLIRSKHFFSLASAFFNFKTSVWTSCRQQFPPVLSKKIMFRWTSLLSLKADGFPGLVLIVLSCQPALISIVHMTPCDGLGLGLWVIMEGKPFHQMESLPFSLGISPVSRCHRVQWPPQASAGNCFYLVFCSWFLRFSWQRVFLGNQIQQGFKICLAEGPLAG